jgi:branched-subunit amino acid aminotransferase/4-amino-4-deoxychorismate lyase
LLTPPHEKVLPGISLAVLRELAQNLALPFSESDLRSDDVASADEVLLVSTSPCVLPATRFNGRPIGTGQVENTSVHSQLLKTWNDLVGLDIAAQAVRFSHRM